MSIFKRKPKSNQDKPYLSPKEAEQLKDRLRRNPPKKPPNPDKPYLKDPVATKLQERRRQPTPQKAPNQDKPYLNDQARKQFEARRRQPAPQKAPNQDKPYLNDQAAQQLKDRSRKTAPNQDKPYLNNQAAKQLKDRSSRRPPAPINKGPQPARPNTNRPPSPRPISGGNGNSSSFFQQGVNILVENEIAGNESRRNLTPDLQREFDRDKESRNNNSYWNPFDDGPYASPVDAARRAKKPLSDWLRLPQETREKTRREWERQDRDRRSRDPWNPFGTHPSNPWSQAPWNQKPKPKPKPTDMIDQNIPIPQDGRGLRHFEVVWDSSWYYSTNTAAPVLVMSGTTRKAAYGVPVGIRIKIIDQSEGLYQGYLTKQMAEVILRVKNLTVTETSLGVYEYWSKADFGGWGYQINDRKIKNLRIEEPNRAPTPISDPSEAPPWPQDIPITVGDPFPPQLEPLPQPERTPSPSPAPWPKPNPGPAPTPDAPGSPVPKPPTTPTPTPTPKPTPTPGPYPLPNPAPNPKPTPDPKPNPGPYPYPNPNPQPNRPPLPSPNPAPAAPKPAPPPSKLLNTPNTTDSNRFDPRPSEPNTSTNTSTTNTNTKEDDMPGSCRYAPDTDVPTQLRVFKGLNPLTKQPIYEVKTVKVHEDMSQAMSLLFDHVSELRGQSDGQFKRILNRLQIVRILNIMSTIATLHNAAMLSRSLADTLGDATSTVIKAIGRATGTLTEEDNIDVNELVGGAFNDLMKGALGEEVWNGTKSTWLKANRVLSSAASIVTTLRSIGDSQRAVAEWTAENTGKIGNALKKWGVVGEKAYSWMPEKVTAKTGFQKKIDDFRGGVDNLDDAASSLTSVASEVVNIQDEAKQIKEQWTAFDKNVKEATAAVRPDNDAAKAASAAAKAASAGKLTGPTDTAPTE